MSIPFKRLSMWLSLSLNMQETKDGELVVLHDLASVLAAAAGHAANEEVLQDLRAAGLQFDDPLGGRSKVRVTQTSTALLFTCHVSAHHCAQCVVLLLPCHL